MSRRLHLPALRLGNLPLSATQLHHVRTVLRLTDGTTVDLFDDAGQTAIGRLRDDSVDITAISAPTHQALSLIIAAAVPKGDRADWMVEKLSELGVTTFVPLAAERSVVLPQGNSKFERWQRIAIESAKQSRRSGVMKIDSLKPPLDPSLRISTAAYLSTAADAQPINDLLATVFNDQTLLLYIGPEGGWTERECEAFAQAALIPLKLTDTILRIETAAVAAAAVVMANHRPSTAATDVAPLSSGERTTPEHLQ